MDHDRSSPPPVPDCRGRGRGRAGALLCLAALVAAGAACTTIPAGSATIPTVHAGNVPLGVYAGTADPAAVTDFATRSGTKPSLASDYLPRDEGWPGLTGVKHLARILTPWQGSPYQLVLGVPMIPTLDGRTVGTMAAGAQGSYDGDFTALAYNLVHFGQSNAILRIGWEFNGTWYPWSVTNDTEAAQYAAYFRHIVTAMRAVPGAAFRFVWNPTSGPEPEVASKAYPGDAYVDYVGLDLYDQVWGIPQDPPLAWARYVTEADGLQWLTTFAAAHHKAPVIPEWGVTTRPDGHGLGDGPLYVARMAQWITQHGVAFSSYFDVDASDGQHRLFDPSFSRSLAIFKRSFAATSPAPLPPTAS
jgi:hypothetical protein